VLPKVRSADDVVVLANRLVELERGSGMKPGVTKILPIATETPAGVLSLAGYARGGPRLAALTWGAEDLSVALGAAVNVDERGEWLPPYQLARSLCLLAAAAAGVAAIDTPYTDFRDTEGLARQAAAARRDGFTGKLAIHPAQVDIINQAFQPDAQEVAAARRIVAAFDAAAGVGVVAVDGKMLDRPHLVRARRTLELADALAARGALQESS
jgi:citrate lyase subunit beta / citryl-CoA lyase